MVSYLNVNMDTKKDTLYIMAVKVSVLNLEIKMKCLKLMVSYLNVNMETNKETFAHPRPIFQLFEGR